jgi:hypothetical protein
VRDGIKKVKKKKFLVEKIQWMKKEKHQRKPILTDTASDAVYPFYASISSSPKGNHARAPPTSWGTNIILRPLSCMLPRM